MVLFGVGWFCLFFFGFNKHLKKKKIKPKENKKKTKKHLRTKNPKTKFGGSEGWLAGWLG